MFTYLLMVSCIFPACRAGSAKYQTCFIYPRTSLTLLTDHVGPPGNRLVLVTPRLVLSIPGLSVSCRCSNGADPVTDPMTLGSVVKVIGSWQKWGENAESVKKSPTGQYTYRQDMMAITTRRRVRDVFCMASRRSTTTSPKPLTDKPHHKQTSRKDKQTSREHVPHPSRQD